MADPKVPGIYAIRNLINGKRYIGSAVNLAFRWKSHRWNLEAGKHHSYLLQRAWDKHGASAFVFEVIEATTDDNLVLREQHWIDHFRSLSTRRGYNVALMAGSTLGTKRSSETKAKISAALRGRKCSPEHVAAMVEGWKQRRLTHPPLQHTAETIKKLRDLAMGRTISLQQREKIAAALRGRTINAEVRAKISTANKGRPISDAQKAMISAVHEGKVYSAESRAKMSRSAKLRAARITPLA